MKIAIITDLHFGIKNAASYFLDMMINYFDNDFIPYLEKNNIDTVFILGDFFDNRKQLNILVFDKINKLLLKFQELKINIFIILGNHDVYYRNTNDINSIDPFLSKFNNIHVIYGPEVHKFDKCNICFLPWLNVENYNDSYNFIKNDLSEYDILCGHLEIDSFEMNTPGIYCKSTLLPEYFSNFKRVFSGHFHLKSEKKNITYIGTPYQLTWADYNQEKGFIVFDTNNYNYSFIKNNNDIFYVVEYVEDLLFDFNYDFYSDKIIKVYIDRERYENKLMIDTFIDKLSKKAYIIEFYDIDNKNEEPIIINYNNPLEMFSKYVDSLKINNSTKEDVKKDIYELYLDITTRQNI